MKKWLNRLGAWLGVAYVAGVVLAALLLRTVGERWWVTAVALYLPRAAFLAPLALIVPLLLIFRRRRLLALQLVAVVIVLFPLMGLALPSLSRGAATRPKIRAMSLNVNQGWPGPERIVAAIFANDPDIVLLQEMYMGQEEVVRSLKERYAAVHASGEFVLASRFPIVSAKDAGKFTLNGEQRHGHFVEYAIDSSLGRIQVYNVHFASPRFSFYNMRGGHGFRRELASGRFFKGEGITDVARNAEHRAAQARFATETATAGARPFLIAGDTNLPGRTPAVALSLGNYQDGFEEAGSGFGYTYPARLPWMRIDRMFASRELEFTSFRVACPDTSDHRCVVAEFARRQ